MNSFFPYLNGLLNLISFVFLLIGFIKIKKKEVNAHRKCMTTAFIISTVFLASYLYYHYNVGHSTFPSLGEELNWFKYLYYIILIPHVILAALMVIPILLTFYFAIKDMRAKHRFLARITLPVWMYVSLTGALIVVFQHIAHTSLK